MARRLISRGSLAARPPADAGATGVLLGAGVGAATGSLRFCFCCYRCASCLRLLSCFFCRLGACSAACAGAACTGFASTAGAGAARTEYSRAWTGL